MEFLNNLFQNKDFNGLLRTYYMEKKNLSSREFEILSFLLKDGKTNKEISNELFIAEKTVKFHNTNIFKKIGIKHRIEVTKTIPISLIRSFFFTENKIQSKIEYSPKEKSKEKKK